VNTSSTCRLRFIAARGVALTRAKNWLYVCFPLRYYQYGPRRGDMYGFAQRTRFLSESTVELFQQEVTEGAGGTDEEDDGFGTRVTSRSIRRRTKGLWS